MFATTQTGFGSLYMEADTLDQISVVETKEMAKSALQRWPW